MESIDGNLSQKDGTELVVDVVSQADALEVSYEALANRVFEREERRLASAKAALEIALSSTGSNVEYIHALVGFAEQPLRESDGNVNLEVRRGAVGLALLRHLDDEVVQEVKRWAVYFADNIKALDSLWAMANQELSLTNYRSVTQLYKMSNDIIGALERVVLEKCLTRKNEL